MAFAAPTLDPAGHSKVEPPPEVPVVSAGARTARPATLDRRVGAGLVDLIWIAVPTVLVARLAGESFVVGSPSSSASTSQLETSAQARPWRLPLVLSDHGPSLSAGALTVILFTMILATAVAGIVVPVLDEGRTPGMALFRLRIVGVDSRRPTAWALGLRTVGSALDLMPLVVPGLVGFAFAASNPRRQRIGDRLAGTTVVHEPRSPRTATVPAKPRSGYANSAKQRLVSSHLNSSRFRPDLPFNTVARLSPGLAGLAVASSGWTLGGKGSMTNHSADTTPWPALGEPLDRPPVAERPRFNPYPKPERPERRQQDQQHPPEGDRRLDFDTTSKPDEAGGSDEAESIDPEVAGSSRDPEWNEDWHSWVYWDEERRQWLRFDSETGEWEPMM